MAHMKKFNRGACGHMFKHYERAKDDSGNYIKFGNQEIDISKSNLNYNLAPAHYNGQGAFVKERCSEVKMQNRPDVNVMCSWIVTAPKELQSDEIEKFFRETYKFLSERYGKDNVVSAYVHMDETTPHMHYAFVPVVKDKKKNILKVSAKEVIDKKELQTFHKDLSGYLEKVFNRDIGILNEATRDGNKSIDELKRGTAKKEYDDIKQNISDLTMENEKQGQQLQNERERIKVFENKKVALEGEIKALEMRFKGQQITAEQLVQIKPEKDFFGNVKNITIDDIENLKKMAITTSKYKIALNKLNQELELLKKENENLKNRVPTIKERIAQKEKENILIEENKKLKQKLDRVDKYIARMPKEMWEEFKKIIDVVKEEQRKNVDIEKDRGYEIGD